METRPALILFVALTALAACTSEPSTPADAPKPKAARSHSGFFIQMPRNPTVASFEAPDGAVVTVTSNLPNGTLAYVTSDIPGYGEETHPLNRFVGGFLTIRKGIVCDDAKVQGDEVDLARGFNVQVIVVPDLSLISKSGGAACKSLTDCGIGPLQPPSVQRVLGRRFERLVGDDVTTVLRSPALVASAHFDWPKRTCRKPLAPAVALPDACPASTHSINDDERGANVDLVLQSVPITIRENRVCDFYNFLSEDIRKRNPWRSFRVRMKRWYLTKRRGAVTEVHPFRVDRGPATVGLAESPRFLDVLYTIGGRLVMRVRFAATADRHGFTRWEITRLELV